MLTDSLNIRYQAANLEQQIEEAAVLRAICGEDCLLLAPLNSCVAPPHNGAAYATACSRGSSSSSSAVGLDAATDDSQPDMAALEGGEPMELQIAIHVHLPPEGIALQEGKGLGTNAEGLASDRSNDDGVTISHLPPLCLRLVFPREYPSSMPPRFQLTALWLTAADTDVLSIALQAQWEEQGPGMPISYGWVEWLQSSCLDAIGVTSCLNLGRLAAEGHRGLILDCQLAGHANRTALDEDPCQKLLPEGSQTDDQSNSGSSSATSAPATWSPGQSQQCGEPLLCRHREQHGSREEDEGISPVVDVDQIAELMMMQLVQYDATRGYALFQQEGHLCPVCYEDKGGTQCMRLEGCGHVFCADCVATHARLHVEEGSVDRLECMDPACRNVLSAQDLGQVLRGEEVQKMEALRLQRALDRMADVVYCPRCQSPTLEDSDGSHCSQCAKCWFVFCSLCNYAYHPSKRCMTAEEALQIHRLRIAGCSRGLGAEMRAKAQRMEEDIKSRAAVEETSKPCPRCSIATHKSGGCNKMTCTRCDVKWCYKCGIAVSGYDHFGQNRCALFNDADIAQWNLEMGGVPANELEFGERGQQEARQGAREPAVGVDLRRCPMCRTQVERFQNNNHMVCSSCGMPFCGYCRAMLRHEGLRHFSSSKAAANTGRCKQHTKH